MVDEITTRNQLAHDVDIENVVDDAVTVFVGFQVLNIGHIAGRQIVDDIDFIAHRQVSLSQVRPYETPPARNQNLHLLSVRPRLKDSMITSLQPL
jgi:hypothetical protein